jgi:hypothetical protein
MKTRSKRKSGCVLARLRLSRIRTDAGTQTRARIDESVAADYAEAMVNGSAFPPVTVFQINGDYVLADGFHRVRAARLGKFDRIEAEVRQGTRLDALKYSLASNHRHGLRRTNEDKQHAVMMALKELSNLSDGAIAELCGVSQPMVSSQRRQLKNFLGSEARLGRDGKRRRLPIKSKPGVPSDGGAPGAGPTPRWRILQSAPPEAVSPQARRCVLGIARKLAGVEDALREAVARYLGQAEVLRGLVAKVRSDLAFLERELNSPEAR